jgi:hypothetical protein
LAKRGSFQKPCLNFQSKLLKTWKDIREEDPSQTMLDWLSIFYNSLLSTWHSELTWCSQVFGKPGRVLCLLMSQSLNHLEPPFSVCVKEFVREEAYPLQQLIDLKQVSAFSLGKTSMREIDYVVRMVVLVIVVQMMFGIMVIVTVMVTMVMMKVVVLMVLIVVVIVVITMMMVTTMVTRVVMVTVW